MVALQTPDTKQMDDLEKNIARVVSMVPKPKKNNSSPVKESATKDVEYHALCAAIRTLMLNQSRILFLNGVISQALVKSEETGDDSWVKVPKYVCNLDKGWMAQSLVKNDPSPKSKIDREFIDNLESQDSKMILNLFLMFTGTAPYTEIPDLMKNSKTPTGAVFKQRAHDIGEIMKDWRHTCCTGNVINMKTGAAYQLKFPTSAISDATGPALATEAVFMRRHKVELNLDETRITSGFAMRDPFSI